MNNSFAQRMRTLWSVCLLFVLISLEPVQGVDNRTSEAFYLRDGDRVVFYGDSITEQAYYTQPIELFVATQYPHWRMRFINSGWGGDRAWGGEGGTLDQRLQRDVIRYKPTVVTVMLGMNDGYYTNFDEKALDVFRTSIEELIATLKHELPRVRITLIGTSPYDNITPGEQPEWEQIIEGGYDSVVARYSQAMGEIAKKHDLLFVDMHEPLVQLLKQLQTDNAKLARQLIPDRIHPGKAAGLIMAAELLKAWQVPVLENLLQIDGAELADGPLVELREFSSRFPLDGSDPLTSYLAARTDHLNLFAPPRLKVTDLPVQWGTVRVDGNDLGSFSAKELSDGVELSAERLPNETANRLAKLIELQNRVHFVKWRMLEVPTKTQSEDITRAANELANIDAELHKLQAEMATPTPHVFEILNVKPDDSGQFNPPTQDQ